MFFFSLNESRSLRELHGANRESAVLRLLTGSNGSVHLLVLVSLFVLALNTLSLRLNYHSAAGTGAHQTITPKE